MYFCSYMLNCKYFWKSAPYKSCWFDKDLFVDVIHMALLILLREFTARHSRNIQHSTNGIGPFEIYGLQRFIYSRKWQKLPQLWISSNPAGRGFWAPIYAMLSNRRNHSNFLKKQQPAVVCQIWEFTELERRQHLRKAFAWRDVHRTSRTTFSRRIW